MFDVMVEQNSDTLPPSQNRKNFFCCKPTMFKHGQNRKTGHEFKDTQIVLVVAAASTDHILGVLSPQA